MATESKKTVRQQLSKVTQTTISPARIRSYLDGKGINRDVEDKLNQIKDDILKIKKEGGPQLPTPPESLKKEATDIQKSKHEEAKNKYAADLKKYNDFVSERYKRLEVVYTLCKHLNKMHALLLKSKRNTNQEKELVELRRIVHDEAPSRKQKESEETYNTRVEKFESSGFETYLGETDLTNADAVQKLIMKLKKNHDGVDLFLQRDETSRSRIRFNDPAAVALATAMELGIEELIEHGMEKTIDSQKKTIQPDHCISPGLEDCDWYVLFKNLPHLRAILDRQKRKAEYNAERDLQKQKAIQKAKSKAKKEKKAYQRPKFKFPTFQESEVEKGFALKTETSTTDDKGNVSVKPHYQWYGIDIEKQGTPENNDHTNFHFYVQQVCKKIVNRRSDVGNSDFLEIKISTNIRKFFSDLIIDFIARISPQIRILIEAMDVKTVDHMVIKTILKMLLVDSYHSATGVIELNEEHESLFKLIDEKVALCQVHQTGQVNKPDAELDENDETEADKTDDHDLDELNEPAPTEPKGHEDDPTADVVKENDTSLEELEEDDEEVVETVKPANGTDHANGSTEVEEPVKKGKPAMAKKITSNVRASVRARAN